MLIFLIKFSYANPFAEVRQITDDKGEYTKNLELIFISPELNEKFQKIISDEYDDIRTFIKPQATTQGVKFIFYGNWKKYYPIYFPYTRKQFIENVIKKISDDKETQDKITYLIDKINGLIAEVSKENSEGYFQKIHEPIIFDDDLRPIKGKLLYFCCDDSDIKEGKIGKIGDLFDPHPYPEPDSLLISRATISFKKKEKYYPIEPIGFVGIKTKEPEGYIVLKPSYPTNPTFNKKLIKYKDKSSPIKLYLLNYFVNLFYVKNYRKIPDVSNKIGIYCGNEDKYDKIIKENFPELWNRYSKQTECEIDIERDNPCIIRGFFKIVVPTIDPKVFNVGIIPPKEKIDICNREWIGPNNEKIKLGSLENPKQKQSYSIFNLGNKKYFNPKGGEHLASFTSSENGIKIGKTQIGDKIIKTDNLAILQPLKVGGGLNSIFTLLLFGAIPEGNYSFKKGDIYYSEKISKNSSYEVLEVFGSSISESEYPKVKDDNLYIVGYSRITYDEKTARDNAYQNAIAKILGIIGETEASLSGVKTLEYEVHKLRKNNENFFVVHVLVEVPLYNFNEKIQKNLKKIYEK